MVAHKPESVVFTQAHRVEWKTKEPTRAEETMAEKTVLVEGMTCGHCVASVTKELMELDGVTEVSVDLDPEGASAVHISSTGGLSPEAVASAIEDAGYSLAEEHSAS